MSLHLRHALQRLAAGEALSTDETRDAVDAIFSGEASEAVVASLLTALRVKGETADELAGAVTAVRDRMMTWDAPRSHGPILDTCGTGGDGACTVNISTATAIVVAACGVPVAKHGNRSASGNSGSAEVLEELGVRHDAELPALARCLEQLGVTFLLRRNFILRFGFAAPIRRQLPFRTIFNLVGPLANPARPDFQLIGVAGDRHADLMADTLCRLGTVRAAVVTGADGLDEVTLDGFTHVRLVERATVERLTWSADDFGLPRVVAEELKVNGPAESAHRIRQLLAGEGGPVRSAVLANSAAALWVASGTDLLEGVRRASEALDAGAARELLERWGRLSHEAT